MKMSVCAVTLALAFAAAAPCDAAPVRPPSGSAAEAAPRPSGLPPDSQLQASGARIGRVIVDRKNIFDTALPEENRSLFRLSNWLHVQTRESTIAARLLFKPGDRYDPRLLQESERLLRNAQFLRDARIRPLAYQDDGTVDVEVSTQDVWTFQPNVTFGRKGGENSGGFGLEETNLLGTGGELGLNYKSGIERDSKSLLFRDRQLAGSWWSLTTQYDENSDGQTTNFELERPFYALDTRWAGGIQVKDDRRIDSIYQSGAIAHQFDSNDQIRTLYGGWSAGLQNGWVTRWTGGITSSRHVAAPRATSLLPGLPAQNLKLVYPWLGVEWIEDDFQQTHNQDQIGKTEDVFFGWRAKVKFGQSMTGLGADRNAGVFDIAVAKGFQPAPRHTLLLTGLAQGRLESSKATATQVGAAGRYYFRRSAMHTFYMAASFDRGIRLDSDRQLLLGGDNGLRGYPLRYQNGDRRWLVTLEERTFTDWYLLRLLRVGGAIFFDMGQASGGRQSGPTAARGTLKDIGLGLRLGNSRTGFGNVIHIDLAFPLDGDKSISKAQLVIETKKSF